MQLQYTLAGNDTIGNYLTSKQVLRLSAKRRFIHITDILEKMRRVLSTKAEEEEEECVCLCVCNRKRARDHF